MEKIENKRRQDWIEQIVTNLELEDHDKDLLLRFNTPRLQYLAKRSRELVLELEQISHSAGDSSLEFKTRKQLKKMKDSLITMVN